MRAKCMAVLPSAASCSVATAVVGSCFRAAVPGWGWKASHPHQGLLNARSCHHPADVLSQGRLLYTPVSLSCCCWASWTCQVSMGCSEEVPSHIVTAVSCSLLFFVWKFVLSVPVTSSGYPWQEDLLLYRWCILVEYSSLFENRKILWENWYDVLSTVCSFVCTVH